MKLSTYLIIISAITLSAFLIAQAGEPRTISHQGFLVDEAGEPVEDDTFIFTFRIYAAESDGDAIWTENQVLHVNSGVFNAVLGSEEELDLPFDEQYWLGITIDGGDELTPRMPLSAAPYALHAYSVADGSVTGDKLDGNALQAGENVSIERDDDNNFVITADTPDGGLASVATDTTLTGDGTGDDPLGILIPDEYIRAEHIADSAVTADKLHPMEATTGQVLMWDGSVWEPGDVEIEESVWSTEGDDIYYDTGYVGIGKDTPAAELSVGGDIHADGQIVINADESTSVSYLRFREPLTGSEGPRIFHSLLNNSLSMRGADNIILDGKVDIDTLNVENVGINTASSQHDLHILQSWGSSTGGLSLYRSNDPTDKYWKLWNSDATNNLHFRYEGSLSAWIDYTDGSYNQSSDRRLKTDIAYLENVLGRVMSLEPVSYRHRNSDRGDTAIGFIAQDVNEIFPEFVNQEGEDGFYGISYAGFSVIAIRAIQEQQEIIERQEEAINRLTEQVEYLLEN